MFVVLKIWNMNNYFLKHNIHNTTTPLGLENTTFLKNCVLNLKHHLATSVLLLLCSKLLSWKKVEREKEKKKSHKNRRGRVRT